MDELTHEQRIAGRLFPAGCAEGLVGLGREGLAQKHSGGVGAQGSGPDHDRQRVGDDLADKAGILPRLLRAQSHHDQELEAFHPWQEVGQPA